MNRVISSPLTQLRRLFSELDLCNWCIVMTTVGNYRQWMRCNAATATVCQNDRLYAAHTSKLRMQSGRVVAFHSYRFGELNVCPSVENRATRTRRRQRIRIGTYTQRSIYTHRFTSMRTKRLVRSRLNRCTDSRKTHKPAVRAANP